MLASLPEIRWAAPGGVLTGDEGQPLIDDAKRVTATLSGCVGRFAEIFPFGGARSPGPTELQVDEYELRFGGHREPVAGMPATAGSIMGSHPHGATRSCAPRRRTGAPSRFAPPVRWR